MKKVMVGMSGGVDSSVAALLLKQQGYSVYGVTLKLRPDAYMCGSLSGGCCSLDDIDDARRVCAALDIPHYVLNFTEIFDREVIAYFASEYRQGRTPNPCIACNKSVKFGQMLDRALAMGMDYIATGHYAVITGPDATGTYSLLRSASAKDQSYVLYGMTQRQLAHTLFPLGEIVDKEATRALARQYRLPVAQKPDSQDICFVENNDYAAFLEKYCGEPAQPGDFVDINGNVIGRHRGITHYTVGQRKGLGVGFGRPMYVTKINAGNNTVTLSEEGGQYAKELTARAFNWISGSAPNSTLRVQAKVRYAAKPSCAEISVLSDGRVQCVFDQAQRSITPGQSVVFYDGDLVLGGGIIE